MSSEKEKTWTSRIQLVLLILAVITGIGVYFTDREKTEHRLWSTPEKKVEGEKHLEEAPNDVDVYKQSRALDSTLKVFLANEKENIQRDSIRLDKVDRNTDQIYQMKELLQQYIKINEQ
jgi:hypothetical protein